MTQSVSARRRFSFQIERRGGSCLTSNDLQSTVAGREIICPTALITTLFRHGVEFHDENLPSRDLGEEFAEVSASSQESDYALATLNR